MSLFPSPTDHARADGMRMMQPTIDALTAEVQQLRAKVEAMQHVVNCASLLIGSNDDEGDGEDDQDAWAELSFAIDAYRACITHPTETSL